MRSTTQFGHLDRWNLPSNLCDPQPDNIDQMVTGEHGLRVTSKSEMLTLVARGKTSIEIAKLLGLSKRTIDFHLDNIRTKLGAATRTEAAAIKAAVGKLIEP